MPHPRLTAFLLLATILFVAACEGTNRLRSEYVIVPGTVEVPDTIRQNEELPVRIAGLIGETDCHSLHEIQVTEINEENEIQIAPIGVYLVEGGTTCRLVDVFMDETVTIEPPFDVGEVVIVLPGHDEVRRFPVTVVAE